MKRIIGLALAFLMLSAPAVSAQEATPAPSVLSEDEQTLRAMDADLAPIHVRVADMNDAILQSSGDLFRAAFAGDTDAARAAADALDAAVEGMEQAAKDGLEVLAGYTPAPCFADYWAMERIGFLALSNLVADWKAADTGFAALGVRLLLVYADLQRSITDCA